METIKQIHLSNDGKVSDKWESYLDFYDSLLSVFKDREIALMEVGVQNGGSLQTWASFFKSARLILGVDIDVRVGSLVYDDPRIRVEIGNVCDIQTFRSIRNISQSFDLIIDDGSHTSSDILTTFISYFPMLSPGGMYIIEDTHCLYQSSELVSESGAYAFFKKLIDVLNFQFWEQQVSIDIIFKTFFDSGRIPSFILEGWVDSIYFRNSFIVIQKARLPGHEKVGSRLITGRHAKVQRWGGVI